MPLTDYTITTADNFTADDKGSRWKFPCSACANRRLDDDHPICVECGHSGKTIKESDCERD